jgi:hypothetical protein
MSDPAPAPVPRPIQRFLVPLGLVVAVAAGAMLAFFLAGGDGGGSPPATATAPPTAAGTPTPAPSATAGGTIEVTPSAERPACVAGQVSGALETERDGDDVRLRLSIEGAARCDFQGEMRLRVSAPAPDAAPGMPPFANVQRTHALAVAFPFSGVIAEWTWSNWCGEAVALEWVAQLGNPSLTIEVRSPVEPGGLPGCLSEGAPTVLRDVRLGEALGGTPMAPECSAPIAGWLCQFAIFLERAQAADELRPLIRTGAQQTYTCGNGVLPGFEYSAVCEGAAEGETRTGYPLVLHGSEGGPVSLGAMISRLNSAIGSPLSEPDGVISEAVSVGFPLDNGEGTRFMVALVTGKQPAVVYLAFELMPGREPAFIGAGLSGDNALVIQRGGVTNSVLGEAEFTPLDR